MPAPTKEWLDRSRIPDETVDPWRTPMCSRHTPSGGTITLSATHADGVATLSVDDSGGGLAPEHLPHVFERLYKGDAARAAESTGSGMGLSITKAIIERHGDTIRATSQSGRASFTFLLPQSAAV